MGFIRDMHRLLSYKGYMFPEVRREDAAVLNPSDVRMAFRIEEAYLTVFRTSNRRMKWKRKRRLPNLRSCRSLFEEEDQRISKKRID